MFEGIIRVVIMLSAAAGGVSLGLIFTGLWVDGPAEIKWALLGLLGIITGLIGYSFAPRLISIVVQTTKWFESRLQKTPTQDIVGGAIGLIIGLIIANLFGVSIYRLPLVGPYLAIAASLIISYLGWSVGTKKKEEFFSFLGGFRLGGKEKIPKTEGPKINYKILDTSVIIDGRIADICKSGFVEGILLIPGFVLEELRHIADSSDLLKRNRGRRGLDILNKIRKELDVMVKIHEKDYEDIAEVDSKLVRLAQELGAPVITNDFNLNKVAELQGVKVLNINELANAVKPIVLPGEEMVVQVIKDGKEMGQGVGYLDDGTMIVVENGKRYIGQTISVLVTSVLQTAAGRMIFAKPKPFEKKFNGQHALEVNAGV
ncbi:PIN/TRAM domain-containing protein [Zhaonella formicivorans]|uniref:PIN/TRAM domain-containing protein n=1 Tax=Zhaonella formicivorans TaxID=2528593 RepID=UPI0010D0547F|nr:PIN/TRAM domain-containing protein [Zhaonella formicivorans]